MKYINNKLKRDLNKGEKRLIESVELVVNRELKKEVFSMTINPLKDNPQDLFGFSVSFKFSGNKNKE